MSWGFGNGIALDFIIIASSPPAPACLQHYNAAVFHPQPAPTYIILLSENTSSLYKLILFNYAYFNKITFVVLQHLFYSVYYNATLHIFSTLHHQRAWTDDDCVCRERESRGLSLDSFITYIIYNVTEENFGFCLFV